jgi:hypothetical protein
MTCLQKDILKNPTPERALWPSPPWPAQVFLEFIRAVQPAGWKGWGLHRVPIGMQRECLALRRTHLVGGSIALETAWFHFALE